MMKAKVQIQTKDDPTNPRYQIMEGRIVFLSQYMVKKGVPYEIFAKQRIRRALEIEIFGDAIQAAHQINKRALDLAISKDWAGFQSAYNALMETLKIHE